MPETKTRREKVAAMADQSASPEEAKVAQAKLATMQKPRLDVIADEVKAEFGKGLDAQFAIGRLLTEAWDLLNHDKKVYGRWLAEQAIPLARSNIYYLRIGAEREPEVRAFITERLLVDEQELGVITATKRLLAPQQPKPGTGEVLPVTDTTPVHRAYDAMRTAHRLLVTESGFEDMHVDDMTKVAGFITDIVEAYKAERGKR